MPQPAQLGAVLFGRQSKDKTKSVDQQLDLGRAACVDNGWPIYAEYREGVSASRFGTKARDEWAKLLDDLEHDRAGVVVLWESSRGDRRLPEWAAFLDLCRTRGKLIHVIIHGRTYDPRIGRDWKTLAEDGLDSAYESEKTSERLRRDMTAAATAGRPHASAPDGYVRRYDPDTRELVEQALDPERSPIVREIITRVSQGHAVSAIQHDLNARGILTRKGNPWSRRTIRVIASNVAYIGKRRHKGETHDALWPALIDETTFWRAQRVLSAPDRKVTRPGSAVYPLSYRLRCDVCGEGCPAHRRSGERGRLPSGEIYRCPQGHAAIRRDLVEAYAFGVVVEVLRRDDAYAALAEVDDTLAMAASDEAARLRVRLDDFRDQAADGNLSAESLARVEKRLLPQIEDAERRARDAAVPPVLRGLVEPGADVAQRLAVMPVAAQREVFDALLVLSLLPIDPARRMRPGTSMTLDRVPERIHIEWRRNGGTTAAAACACYRCATG